MAALAAICVLAAMMVASLGGTAGARQGGGCPNASDPATQVSTGQLAKSITCLVNAERTQRGRKALGKVKQLTKAAKKHTAQMVQTNCLDHLCGSEPDLFTRIKNTGYFSGARAFDYAEDVGCETTTERMVKNWMGSSLHRRNILNRKFRDVGVGASHERIPSRCSDNYASFTIVFGYSKG